MIRLFLVLLLVVSVSRPATAEEYAPITLQNLVNSTVRFNALDLREDDLLDDYAKITDCELFEHFYRNDFHWQQVRAAMRESVRLNAAA